MKNNDDYRTAVWSYFKQSRACSIILVQEDWLLYETIIRKPGAKGHFVSEIHYKGDISSFSETLCEKSGIGDCNWAFISPSGEKPDSDLLDLILKHGIRPEFFKQGMDGKIIDPDGNIKTIEEIMDDTIHVSIQGSNKVVFENVHLPLEVNLSLRGPKSKKIISIEGECSHTKILDKTWFRLEGNGDSKLIIDVMTEKDASWDISLDGKKKHVKRIHSPKESNRDINTRLAIIIDRTCPDEKRWKQARSSISGSQVKNKPSDEMWQKSGDNQKNGDDGNSTDYQDFNFEIRNSVSKSLESYINHHNVIYDFWGFIDKPGNGLVGPKNISFPLEEDFFAGSSRPEEIEEISSILNMLTYYPGLDLWDPLEIALEKAVNKLLDDKDSSRRWVIIVGNSPPNVPYGKGSPFHEYVLDGFNKHRTNYRRKTYTWDYTIKKCIDEGILIVYLFLTHKPHGLKLNANEKVQFEIFSSLMQKVYSAIEKYEPIMMLSEPANEKGIISGINRAMSMLSAPELNVSSVRVLNENS